MYKAVVIVPGHNNAVITYNGKVIGKGTAKIKIPRIKANRVLFTVQDENCEPQKFYFTSRKFRGWSLAGSIFFWTFLVGSVLLPIGTVIDLATGALWKPNNNEPGVYKKSYKNYEYQLFYNNCSPKKEEPTAIKTKDKIQMLLDLKKLLDQNILTQEEFDKEKSKILDEK